MNIDIGKMLFETKSKAVSETTSLDNLFDTFINKAVVERKCLNCRCEMPVSNDRKFEATGLCKKCQDAVCRELREMGII